MKVVDSNIPFIAQKGVIPKLFVIVIIMSVGTTQQNSVIQNYNPAGTWCSNDVVLMSMRRIDIASTSVRHHVPAGNLTSDCDVYTAPCFRHFIKGNNPCVFLLASGVVGWCDGAG